MGVCPVGLVGIPTRRDHIMTEKSGVAVAKAMAAMTGVVPKGDYNEYSKYAYASER